MIVVVAVHDRVGAHAEMDPRLADTDRCAYVGLGNITEVIVERSDWSNMFGLAYSPMP